MSHYGLNVRWTYSTELGAYGPDERVLDAVAAWEFALWQFEGPFGIVGHRRPGASFERRDGLLVDRNLLDLMRQAFV